MIRAGLLSDDELRAELLAADKSWNAPVDPDDEGHGGSPREGEWERLGELEAEARRRGMPEGRPPKKAKLQKHRFQRTRVDEAPVHVHRWKVAVRDHYGRVLRCLGCPAVKRDDCK